jgi:curved DNA-binding protein CbpA
MAAGNYYEVLGLAPGADGAMVDQAYWHLAKTYQQQAPQDPRAEHLLDELNEAYGVLGTPRLREAYDAELIADITPGRPRLVAKAPSERSGGIKFPRPRIPFTGKSKRKSSTTDSSPARPVIAATSRVNGRDKAQDLRASTAAMLERWRSNAGIQPAAEQPASAPDTTLVDIFRSEQAIEAAADDPLTSVMEVLRRSKAPATAE